jgi:tetratricopeptide (TPR) repeat protein
LLVVLLAALTSVLAAKPGVVKTTDGRRMDGDITEDRERGTVNVLSHGVVITLKREDVASIEYLGEFQEQYRQRLAAMGATPGSKQHMEVARWLFDQREYDLAREHAEKARALDPRNTEIPVLIDTIIRQRQLDLVRPATRDTTAPPPATRLGALPKAVLTPDQIQVVRRYELTRADRNVRFRFDNNVIRRFVDLRSLNAARFQAAADFEKAMAIYTDGLAQMHPDVKILGDPQALVEYKIVQRTILTGCASSACHGGAQAGKFFLYNPADNDATTYTNFYILTQYGQWIGAAGAGAIRHKAIDRLHPEDSLVLQYGLPANQAKIRHKDVPNFKPTFANMQLPTYRAILSWIGQTLRPDEVNYGIDFKPPSPATAPSKTP